MQKVKKVILINASPKIAAASASENLNNHGEAVMKPEKIDIFRIDVRRSLTQKTWNRDFESMRAADAIVFTFPLYIFCLPGLLMRFLQEYSSYLAKSHDSSLKTKVYAVANCGFPEAHINTNAVETIRCFSKKIGADFRFGMMVGGGGLLVAGVDDTPFMKKTYAAVENGFRMITRDIHGQLPEGQNNIHVDMMFPRMLYLHSGDMGWVRLARRNGLKKKQLYAKPYIS